jgi:hypothetical protein
MTIKEFIELNKILRAEGDELDKQLEVLELLTGEDYSDRAIIDVHQAFQKHAAIKTTLKFNKIKIDNLYFKINTNVTSLTAGQLYTIRHIIENSENEVDNINSLIGVISTVYKKRFFIKKKVDMSLEEKSELLLKANAAVAFGVSSFFLLSYQSMLKRSSLAGNKEVEALINDTKKVTDIWMRGVPWQTFWEKELKMLLS